MERVHLLQRHGVQKFFHLHFAEEMAEYKREEKELEEAKYVRSTGAR